MYHIFYLWFVIVCRSKESLYDDARLIGYFSSANPGPDQVLDSGPEFEH